MAALVIDLATDSIASDSLPLRDALMEAAIGAAVHRAGTDLDAADALWTLAGLIGGACCDETALAVHAAAPEGLRAEVLGAVTDGDLIAAITGGGGGSGK